MRDKNSDIKYNRKRWRQRHRDRLRELDTESGGMRDICRER